jgi:hypothetical protein
MSDGKICESSLGTSVAAIGALNRKWLRRNRITTLLDPGPHKKICK